jgi:hypothetical protein
MLEKIGMSAIIVLLVTALIFMGLIMTEAVRDEYFTTEYFYCTGEETEALHMSENGWWETDHPGCLGQPAGHILLGAEIEQVK